MESDIKDILNADKDEIRLVTPKEVAKEINANIK